MESPYRPPQELESVEYSSPPSEGGVFQFQADERQTVGRLAKYLSDIGGLLIFVSVISLLLALLTLAVPVSMQAGGSFQMMATLGLQVMYQLINVVCLFAIGLLMRGAGAPLRQAAEGTDRPMPAVMASMAKLRTMYAWQIGFVGIGILMTIATRVLNFPL